jgi:hypothetical protein
MTDRRTNHSPRRFHWPARARLVALGLVAVLVGAVAPAGLAAAADGVTTISFDATRDYDRAFAVLDLVNAERAKNGAAPLTLDRGLMEAAMQRAAEAALSFSHTRPDGRTCFTAFPEQAGSTQGENLAWGQKTAATVVKVWMDSPGHRANIVNPSFTALGVGALVHGDRVYWAQLFTNAKAEVATNPGNGPAVSVVQVRTADLAWRVTTSATSVKVGGTAQITASIPVAEHPAITVRPEHLSYTLSGAGGTVGADGVFTATGPGTATVAVTPAGAAQPSASVSIAVGDTTAGGPDASTVASRPVLAKAVIKTLRASSTGQLTVRWAKVANARGFQVLVAKNKSFTKGRVKALAKQSSARAVTLSKLKTGTRYYAKVRAYALVSGAKVFGPWSKSVTLRVPR